MPLASIPAPSQRHLDQRQAGRLGCSLAVTQPSCQDHGVGAGKRIGSALSWPREEALVGQRASSSSSGSNCCCSFITITHAAVQHTTGMASTLSCWVMAGNVRASTASHCIGVSAQPLYAPTTSASRFTTPTSILSAQTTAHVQHPDSYKPDLYPDVQ